MIQTLLDTVDELNESERQELLARLWGHYHQDFLKLYAKTYPMTPDHHKLLEIVAKVYGSTIGGIQSNEREHREARFAAASLLYSICQAPLRVIGEVIRPQGVDHTSVVYWIDNVTETTKYYMSAQRFCKETGRDYDDYSGRIPERTGKRTKGRSKAVPSVS